jgi:hypothetical protein
VCPTPSSRRLARRVTKKIDEVRIVSKAAFRRDPTKRVVGHQQKPLSTGDSRAHYIPMRRAAKALLEQAEESIRGHLHRPNEFHYPDCGMQMRGNVRLEGACLPRRHGLAARPHRLLCWKRFISTSDGRDFDARFHVCSRPPSSIEPFAVCTAGKSGLVFGAKS